MTDLLDVELNLIVWLRQIVPGLVGPFEALTYMGNEMFFLLFLPLVYWCLDRRTGARVTILFLISAATNSGAKALFDQPRPFDYAPDRVRSLFEMPLGEAVEKYEAVGNGFPSGHTQNTVTIWGYLASQAYRLRGTRLETFRPLLLALAGLLILLIPLSRIYLAVHFPRDLVGGYFIGAALLVLFIRLEPSTTHQWARLNLTWQMGIALAIPGLAMLVYPDETIVTAGATLMGMGAGFVMERRWLRFETAGPWWRRALRYVLGIAGMLVLYAGLKAAFSGLEPVLLWRFIRYLLMGLWGSVGAPWAFVKSGLAGKQPPGV